MNRPCCVMSTGWWDRAMCRRCGSSTVHTSGDQIIRLFIFDKTGDKGAAENRNVLR